MKNTGFTSYFSLRSWKLYLKDVYLRITLNRLTICFLIFSIVHCFTQGFLQTVLFTLDDTYRSTTQEIVNQGNISDHLVPAITGTYGSLEIQLCHKVPMYFPETCTTVFSPSVPPPSLAKTRAGPRIIRVDGSMAFKPDRSLGHNQTGAVGVSAFTKDFSVDFTLDPACPEVMSYVAKFLNQIKREDIAWICLHFWLFIISFLAIRNRSVPHLLTVLSTRFLATAWSGYAIWRTYHRRRWMLELAEGPNSACDIDFTGPYFDTRSRYEICDVILNFTGLVLGLYLSIRLLKDYSQKSFNTVGATEKVYRIQKFFDAVICVLELEISVVLIAMALWIDEISVGPLANVTERGYLYRAGIITTAVTLWPWIALGWYSIRKESNKGIYIFMAYAFALVFVWSFMFYSHSYRWTFYDWPYFGCYATASLILLVASFIFGLICRLNFGQGLKQYLNAEEALQATGIRPEVFTRLDEKDDVESIPEDADPAFYLKKYKGSDLPGYENDTSNQMPTLHANDQPLARTISGESKMSLKPNRLM